MTKKHNLQLRFSSAICSLCRSQGNAEVHKRCWNCHILHFHQTKANNVRKSSFLLVNYCTNRGCLKEDVEKGVSKDCCPNNLRKHAKSCLCAQTFSHTDKSDNWDARKESGDVELKRQYKSYRNACNSCLLWDRVGWPSGSTSRLLFSAPERERRIKNIIIITSTPSYNCSL